MSPLQVFAVIGCAPLSSFSLGVLIWNRRRLVLTPPVGRAMRSRPHGMVRGGIAWLWFQLLAGRNSAQMARVFGARRDREEDKQRVS
jgi:hypothetical protein